MVLSDLNEVENSFRRLAENLPGIVYRVLIEDDNRTIFFNDMVQTMTGYSPEDLKRGKVCSIGPIILPEDRLNVINIVKDAIENNVPFEVEYRINNKSGDVKWFSERGRPIRGDNGNPSYIDGVIFDITDRKEAEQKLNTSELNILKVNKYKILITGIVLGVLFWVIELWMRLIVIFFIEALSVYSQINFNKVKTNELKLKSEKEKAQKYLDIAGVIIVAINTDQTVQLINQKGCELLEEEESKIIGMNWFDNYIPENVREQVKITFNRILSGEIELLKYYENAVITKNGKKRVISWYNQTLKNEAGQIIGTLSSGLDITERKKAEQKLIESEEKFRTIAERTFMGILIVQDNQVKYANDALLNMFEYSQKEIANWEMDDLTKLINSEDLSFLREYREHLRSGDKSLKPYYSYRVLTKSGKMKWIDQFSKEIQYKGRSAELVTIMDITEKKEAEQELVKLNNLKSELLRRTSHELKTPLVSIKGFSDLLLELHRDKLDDYVIKTIKQIKGGCSRLESLVNDILKTAELESGTVELKKSKEDLSLLIKLCVNDLRGLSELRNHKIILNIPDELIGSFEKEQIYNVITNILINAINFTPYNGKIEVKSEINNDFIIISIRDNGIGFIEEEKTQVFKQFGKIERYGQGYDVISEGSGLGLYISKKIVELHGGEIWLESEGRNKGSTFNVSLPIDKK